ncbi:MAG: hypothetical protein K6G26_10955 [Lachnospiraceae bacterium]|nr:hypothetical protein [Lachnospiraceae bacterium]
MGFFDSEYEGAYKAVEFMGRLDKEFFGQSLESILSGNSDRQWFIYQEFYLFKIVGNMAALAGAEASIGKMLDNNK